MWTDARHFSIIDTTETTHSGQQPMKVLIISTNAYLVQQAIEIGAAMIPFTLALAVVSYLYKRDSGD